MRAENIFLPSLLRRMQEEAVLYVPVKMPPDSGDQGVMPTFMSRVMGTNSLSMLLYFREFFGLEGGFQHLINVADRLDAELFSDFIGQFWNVLPIQFGD